MDFVPNFADVVTVMHGGRVLAEGPVREIQENPKVQEVYLGHAETRCGRGRVMLELRGVTTEYDRTMVVHHGRTSPGCARTGGDSAASSAIDEVLDLFPVLKEQLSRRAGLLSGGQRQQLAIARTLLTKPRMLVLDEPTEASSPMSSPRSSR